MEHKYVLTVNGKPVFVSANVTLLIGKLIGFCVTLSVSKPAPAWTVRRLLRIRGEYSHQCPPTLDAQIRLVKYVKVFRRHSGETQRTGEPVREG